MSDTLLSAEHWGRRTRWYLQRMHEAVREGRRSGWYAEQAWMMAIIAGTAARVALEEK